jgi:hypothetical protein
MFQSVLLALACLSGGLSAGSAYTTFFELAPAGATTARWVQHMQYVVRRIGVPLFVLQPIAGLSTIASAALARDDGPSFGLLAAASVGYVTAGLITRAVHIPINRQLVTWNVDALPPNAADMQRRWWRFHVVRAAALVLGFGALVLGCMARRA